MKSMGVGKARPQQDYKFLGVLYPDAQDYNCSCVLQEIQSYFTDYAYILHDKDKNQDGTLKKAHIHWIGIKKTETGRESYITVDTVASVLGIAQNYIERAKSLKSSIRYLIHADDDDKEPYDLQDIVSNISVVKYFKEYREAVKSCKISEYIIHSQATEVTQIIPWVFEMGLYSEFRRGYAIWHTLIRENLERQMEKGGNRNGKTY